jgi:predicted choloylglycine hydrolase
MFQTQRILTVFVINSLQNKNSICPRWHLFRLYSYFGQKIKKFFFLLNRSKIYSKCVLEQARDLEQSSDIYNELYPHFGQKIKKKFFFPKSF